LDIKTRGIPPFFRERSGSKPKKLRPDNPIMADARIEPAYADIKDIVDRPESLLMRRMQHIAIYRGAVFLYCPESCHTLENYGTSFRYIDLSR
jgi:hypothetical protein